MNNRIILLILFLIASPYTFAKEGGAHVFVHATANDPVGVSLVFELREAIRGSSGMDLVFTEDDAFINLRVVTLDPDDDGNRTIYSVVWTIKQIDRNAHLYWSNSVGTCGRKRVRECAVELAADTDQIVTTWQETITNLLKNSGPEEDKPKSKQKQKGGAGL